MIFAMGSKMGAVALAEGDFADDPILRIALKRAVAQVGRTQEVARFGQFSEPLLIGLPPTPTVTVMRPSERMSRVAISFAAQTAECSGKT